MTKLYDGEKSSGCGGLGMVGWGMGMPIKTCLRGELCGEIILYRSGSITYKRQTDIERRTHGVPLSGPGFNVVL